MNPQPATTPTLFDAAFAALGRDVALLVFLLVPAVAVTVGALALPRLRRWAQAQERADWEARLGLWWSAFKRYYLAVLIVGAVVLLGGDWWRLIAALRDSAIGAVGQLAVAYPADPAQEAAFRNLVLNLGVAMTALVAAATAPFALLKAWINERATQTTEQTHLTSLFTDAVEKLGATRERKTEDGKTVTEPNIEVRLGAIYALERIAADSERDHIPVMETLCAYIRENTKGVRQDYLSDKGAISELNYHLRADVQSAITVIGRRSASRVNIEQRGRHPFKIELSSVELSGGIFYGLDFRNAKFTKAQLRDAKMANARLDGAWLHSANLTAAYLKSASLKNANFRQAKLTDANLWDCCLDYTNLTMVDFRHADLIEAHLKRAILYYSDLSGARLDNAIFFESDLGNANVFNSSFLNTSIKCSFISEVDFTNAHHLKSPQISEAFGDGTTVLPEGILRPKHWTTERMERQHAHRDWRRWIAAGCPKTADWRDRAPPA